MKLKEAKKLIAKWKKEDREHNASKDPYTIHRPPSAIPLLKDLVD